MGVAGGPNIERDGLVFAIDASSRRSTLRATEDSNILPSAHNWTTGEGNQTGYSGNGSSSEQNRVSVNDDPWGRTSITWKTTPDATSGADGGWNSTYYSIDTNYTYRWSVWVRRYTEGTGGTFYLGMNPAPIRNDDNTVQGNPYWYCPSISSLTYNRWYLVVGFCFHQNYTGGRHPDSGYWYKDESGNVLKTDLGFCNTGQSDVRWNPGTTSAQHRTYHYYTTNTSSGIEFAYPRVDKIDGNEPSISELIYRGESGVRGLVTKSFLTLSGGISYSGTGFKKSFSFDGTDDTLDLGIPLTSLPALSNFAIECVVKIDSYPTAASPNGYGSTTKCGVLVGAAYYCGTALYWYGNSSGTTCTIYAYIRGNDGYRTAGAYTLTPGQYHHLVLVNDYTNSAINLYANGVLNGTYAGPTQEYNSSLTPSAGNIGVSKAQVDGGGEAVYSYLPVNVPVVKIYTKALSAQQVQQNYKAYKNRFNL